MTNKRKNGKTFKIAFRRRRESKTDYSKRLALVKSRQIRLVVRKTNTRIIAQATIFDLVGDKTLTSVDSNELNQFGFYGTNNTPSAYLTGYLLGKKLGAKKAVLDIGRQSPSHGSVIFATLKGFADAGVLIPFNPSAVPSEDRINGKVLDEYAKKLGDKAEKLFSGYTKLGIKPGAIHAAFNLTKKKIDETVQPVIADIVEQTPFGKNASKKQTDIDVAENKQNSKIKESTKETVKEHAKKETAGKEKAVKGKK
jgi:large subunit ribosomal protein L18